MVILRGVVAIVIAFERNVPITAGPHLHILLVVHLLGLPHQILVVLDDLRMLKTTIRILSLMMLLFSHSLNLSEVLGIATTNTLSRVKVSLVALIVLQHAGIDALARALSGVRTISHIHAFITHVLGHSLGLMAHISSRGRISANVALRHIGLLHCHLLAEILRGFVHRLETHIFINLSFVGKLKLFSYNFYIIYEINKINYLNF